MTNAIIPTNPTALVTYMEFAEVDANRAADARRMLRNERMNLVAAMRSGDAAKIAAARDEAVRTATMWEGY